MRIEHRQIDLKSNAEMLKMGWYVFINRRRTMVKVLGFEHGGFFIWAKRLEQGLFASPSAPGRAALSLSRTELSALLEGIDIAVRRRRKRYAAPVTGVWG